MDAKDRVGTHHLPEMSMADATAMTKSPVCFLLTVAPIVLKGNGHATTRVACSTTRLTPSFTREALDASFLLFRPLFAASLSRQLIPPKVHVYMYMYVHTPDRQHDHGTHVARNM